MERALSQLLNIAINFLRKEVFEWWLGMDVSFLDPAIVNNIKNMASKLRPTGHLDQDMVLFNSALNVAHSTGTMAEYLESECNLPDNFLNNLSGDQYINRWDRELRKMAQQVDEVRIVPIPKTADDPVKDQQNYRGIKIDIEWPKGSIRSYEGDDTYVTHMKCSYGRIKNIQGVDGDELDCYVGDKNSDIIYIIEQLNDESEFDEQKLMIGFDSEEEAADMYLQHMPAYMLGDVSKIPLDKLKNALYGDPEDRRGQEDLIPSEEQ
jgi:hypothetical protein